MDLENQEVELNEPVETIVDEVATEEVVADEIDDDAEITGDDALAILAGEDTDETPAEEPAEETVVVAEEEVTAKTPEEEENEEDAELLESITNERTRERFQSLSHKNKELIEASEQQTQVIDAFKNQVTSTGLSNEDFTQVIGLMGKANSPDMNSVKEARAFIRDLDKTLTERICNFIPRMVFLCCINVFTILWVSHHYWHSAYKMLAVIKYKEAITTYDTTSCICL